jgi:hypothetical protein
LEEGEDIAAFRGDFKVKVASTFGIFFEAEDAANVSRSMLVNIVKIRMNSITIFSEVCQATIRIVRRFAGFAELLRFTISKMRLK